MSTFFLSFLLWLLDLVAYKLLDWKNTAAVTFVL